jgi:hypothetical protein
MKRTSIFAASSIALVAACSSNGGSGTTSGGGHTTTTGTHSTTTTSTHMNMCVMTTDKGNANGVGAYCTPGGGECSKFPNAGVCLADVGQSEWFCTKIGCMTNADCGDMATCYMQPGGSACVPNKCLSGTGGSGTGGSGTGGSGTGGAGTGGH